MRLEPGQSPPLAIIGPNDQRGVIYVTGGFALAATLISLMTRAYVRAGFGQTFGTDDYALGLAWLFMIAQTIAVFVAAHNGLGETSTLIGHGQADTMQQAVLAADIFYMFTLWTSRCSSVFFCKRLSRNTRYDWIWTVFLASTGVLGLACLLTVCLRCDLSHAWLFIDQHCTGVYDRWLAATVISIVFEGALFAQLVFIIAKLQMASATKLKVIVPFAGRLLLIAPLILHLLAIPPFYHVTTGARVSAFNMTRPYIYTQIILALAIITPTLPVLQPFMQATATTFGMVSGEATNAYGSKGNNSNPNDLTRNSRAGRRSRQNMFSLKSFRSTHGGDDQDGPDDGMGSINERSRYQATVSHGQRVRSTSHGGSDISQQPIIRRDVQYTVSYSDAQA